MRICAIIPNNDWRQTAGVRIRYDRMRPALETLGVQFELETIEALLATDTLKADVYLICKCHDARALVLARKVKQAGCRLGIDIFDDYYSDTSDSRFEHLRNWFQSISAHADFLLCATSRMQRRLATLSPQIPCHVLNDPAPPLNTADIAQTLDRTRAAFLHNRVVEIGWFGIGDNPHFQLGLDDLAAYGNLLAECRKNGFEPRLRILTNLRAMTATRLEALSNLPVPFLLDEWSEAKEKDLIASCLFCFLPVNGQRFSTVKSLNRAVSVLAGGSQVLSAGFPLYDALQEFIYRDVRQLLQDAKADKLRMRAQTLDAFAKQLERLGSTSTEATALLSFLARVKQRPSIDVPGQTDLLLIGHRSPAIVQQQLGNSGALRVMTPRTPGKPPHDVKVCPLIEKHNKYRVRLELNEAALQALKPHWQGRAIQAANGKPHRLDLFAKDFPGNEKILAPGTLMRMESPFSPQRELARYERDMRFIRIILELVFKAPRLTLSEMASPFPGLTAAD